MLHSTWASQAANVPFDREHPGTFAGPWVNLQQLGFVVVVIQAVDGVQLGVRLMEEAEAILGLGPKLAIGGSI